MFKFIEEKNSQLIAREDLSILIDQEMFEDGIAEIVDDKVSTMGIFKIVVGKKRYNVSLPITVLINAPDLYKEENYYKIDFLKNDIIIDKTLFFLSATIGAKNANNFLTALTTAKIHPKRPGDLVKLFKTNTSMNGIKVDVQSVLLESMIAELCRYEKDETIPFRIALKNKSVKENEFKLVNIKEISRLSSVFNAISFEDIKKSLESAVLMTRNKTEQSQSPVEKVLKY